MELDALTNLEHIGLCIRLLPTFGDLRNDLIGFSVNCHQGVENLTGDLNCRCFFALMGVKRGDISALRPDGCILITFVDSPASLRIGIALIAAFVPASSLSRGTAA